MLTGLLLKESLTDLNVLVLLQITKTETWNVDNAADFQPKVWTAISFTADEDQAADIAEKLRCALKPAWFIDASTTSHKYVIFPEKVFCYRKGDSQQRAQAVEYGRSLGIPPHQLDWGE
jgi:hypothetical protein